MREGLCGQLNCFVTSVGKWWGTNPSQREQTDIDVVGIDIVSNKAVLGECKFRNEPIDKNVYEALMQRNNLIDKKYKTVQYILFSLSGFSRWIIENADKSLVKLVSLADMYK